MERLQSGGKKQAVQETRQNKRSQNDTTQRHRNPMLLAVWHHCLMPHSHDSRASGSSSIHASRPSTGSRRSSRWPAAGSCFRTHIT